MTLDELNEQIAKLQHRLKALRNERAKQQCRFHRGNVLLNVRPSRHDVWYMSKRLKLLRIEAVDDPPYFSVIVQVEAATRPGTWSTRPFRLSASQYRQLEKESDT